MSRKWVSRPQQHGRRWRLDLGEGASRTQRLVYDTEEEAKKGRARLLREINKEEQERATLTMEAALQGYMHYKEHDKANAPRTLELEHDRVVRFFGRAEGALPRLTAETARSAYRAMRERLTQYGRPPSDAEQQGCLKAARRFGKYLVKEGLWKDNPLLLVEIAGKPKAGEESKPQHGHDEQAQLVLCALDLGEQGDAGAAAVLCGVLCGMRAGAIASRERRHFDAGGTILRTQGKTRAGLIDLVLVGRTPEEEAILMRLRRVLALQAQDKLPTAPLIGTGHDRYWVRKQSHRICKAAGVSIVTAHALRGGHTSAAYAIGESPAAVARSIGHTSEHVARRHYATQQAQAQGGMARALQGITRTLGSVPENHSPNTPHGEEESTQTAPVTVGAREGS